MSEQSAHPRVARGATLLSAVGSILFSSAVARGLAVLKGLFLAAVLSPSEYGVATLIAILVAYSAYADLGTSTAAARELSMETGRANSAVAAVALRHLTALRVAGGLLAASFALALSFWPGLELEARTALRWAFPVVLASCVMGVALWRWQAESRTSLLAKGTLVQSLLDLLIAVVLAGRFGLTGLLWALFVAPSLGVAWAATHHAFVRPLWPRPRVLSDYLGIGVQWLALGLLQHNLVYVDHFLVMGFFGVKWLGVYNVALIVSDIPRIFGLAVGIVLGPRLLQCYAARIFSIEGVRELTLVPVKILAAALPLLVSPLYFVAKGGILAFYPLYAGAIPLLSVLLLGAQFLAINNGASSFLLAVGKQGRGALITGFCLLFDVTVAGILVRRGDGLLAIAAASLAAYLLFSVVYLTYVSSHFESSARERILFLVQSLLPGLYLAGVLSAVDAWLPRPGWPGGVLAAVGLSWMLLSPLVPWALAMLRRIEGQLGEADLGASQPAGGLSP